MHQPAPSSIVLSWPASVAAGLRAAWRHRRVAVWIWAAFLLLAAIATVPTWRGYEATLSHTPESERLLDGLNVALLREMATSGGAPGPAVVLPWMMLAAAAIALLWNPFLSGGLIAVLTGDGSVQDVRGLRERFFGGGGRHYWRLLALLITMLVIGAIVLALVGGALFGIGARIGEGGQEQLSMALTIVNIALLAALAGLLSIALDFARIAMVRDERRMWTAIWTGIRMLFRRPVSVIAFGLTFALLFAVLIGVYVPISSSLSFRGWSAIWIGVVLQQLFALTRTGLRVAMVAGEVAMLPVPPVPVPLPEPEPAPEPLTPALPMAPEPSDAPPASEPPAPSLPLPESGAEP
jgi:hypothetical protein